MLTGLTRTGTLPLLLSLPARHHAERLGLVLTLLLSELLILALPLPAKHHAERPILDLRIGGTCYSLISGDNRIVGKRTAHTNAGRADADQDSDNPSLHK